MSRSGPEGPSPTHQEETRSKHIFPFLSVYVTCIIYRDWDGRHCLFKTNVQLLTCQNTKTNLNTFTRWHKHMHTDKCRHKHKGKGTNTHHVTLCDGQMQNHTNKHTCYLRSQLPYKSWRLLTFRSRKGIPPSFNINIIMPFNKNMIKLNMENTNTQHFIPALITLTILMKTHCVCVYVSLP